MVNEYILHVDGIYWQLLEEDGFFFAFEPVENREEKGGIPGIKAELEEYFCGKRKTFTLSMRPKGTPFQQRVWKALEEIPYGESRTYKEIAEAIGCKRGYQAVGQAVGRNPLPIFIPCHRVLGKNGAITGFGLGLAMKRRLLKLEGIAWKE